MWIAPLGFLAVLCGAPAAAAQAQTPVGEKSGASKPSGAMAAEAETTNPAGQDAKLADRVKSVQPESFRLAHRLSFTLDGTASFNDAFFQKWGGGGQIAFAISDPFSLVAHFDYYGDQETDNVVTAKEVLSSQFYATRMRYLGGLDLAWTPMYGKLAVANSILHFDLYVLAGLDGAGGEQGLLPAGDVGVGERLFFTDWFSAGIEARYVFYVDHATGEPGMLERPLLASAVATFWLPSPGGKDAP